MATQDSPSASNTSRRNFIKNAATAGAGVMIVPRHVLGQGMTPPSDLVNIATVGVSGMGASNTQAIMSQNVVALCDVDFGLLDTRLNTWRNSAYPIAPAPTPRPATGQAATAPQPTFTDFGRSKPQQAANTKWTPEQQAPLLRRFVDRIPRMARYRDYREMLDKQKDIDARHRRHARSHARGDRVGGDGARQARVRAEAALLVGARSAAPGQDRRLEHEVVTQMGNQGHSQDDARRGQEYLMAGAIGDVREVHVWTNRPLGYWPQGVPRPAAPRPEPRVRGWNNTGVTSRLAAAHGRQLSRCPTTLSWDLFLGVAPDVDVSPDLPPVQLARLGGLGPGRARRHGRAPDRSPGVGLEARAADVDRNDRHAVQRCDATRTRRRPYYEFPARDGHAGGEADVVRRRPDCRRGRRNSAKRSSTATGGILYIGSKGKMLQDTYGTRPRLLPMRAAQLVRARRRNSWRASRTSRTR